MNKQIAQLAPKRIQDNRRKNVKSVTTSTKTTSITPEEVKETLEQMRKKYNSSPHKVTPPASTLTGSLPIPDLTDQDIHEWEEKCKNRNTLSR